MFSRRLQEEQTVVIFRRSFSLFFRTRIVVAPESWNPTAGAVAHHKCACKECHRSSAVHRVNEAVGLLPATHRDMEGSVAHGFGMGAGREGADEGRTSSLWFLLRAVSKGEQVAGAPGVEVFRAHRARAATPALQEHSAPRRQDNEHLPGPQTQPAAG